MVYFVTKRVCWMEYSTFTGVLKYHFHVKDTNASVNLDRRNLVKMPINFPLLLSCYFQLSPTSLLLFSTFSYFALVIFLPG